jgi:hypothetical protein
MAVAKKLVLSRLLLKGKVKEAAILWPEGV